MKKVCIKTWSGGTNYGTNPQAFALKRALDCLGYEPVFVGVIYNVNYFIHPDMLFRRIYKRIKRKYKNSVVFSEMHNEYADQYAKQAKIFSDFCRKEFPKLQVRSRKQWKQVREEYEAFITGSDQVWNPYFFEEEYMLDFIQEDYIKKISYASSVGVTSIDFKTRRKYKKLLKSYNAISVRESSGVSVLQNISPVPVHVVLDPTTLLEKCEWDSFTREANIKDVWVSMKNIFCAIL